MQSFSIQQTQAIDQVNNNQFKLLVQLKITNINQNYFRK